MDKEMDKLFRTADFARNAAHYNALRQRLFGSVQEDAELNEDDLELVAAARKDPVFPPRPRKR